MQPGRKCLFAIGILTLSSASVLAQDAAPLKQEELEQIVAPIALYPDSLISQILMASTYPLEVVEADRWTTQNKSLSGDALAAELEKQPWDASVKSLVNFPQVLSMMSLKLDWTTKLGDAFLAQQKPVMDAIQTLRGKAKAEGNLETTKEQKVVVQQEAQTQVIVIESADPQVMYVPTYNPTVVYGSWPYPSHPPYYYYPPGYVAGTAALSFGLGVAAGAVWANNGWGSCNWGHGDVDIDVRGGNSFNRTNIDNSRTASNVGNRNTNAQGGGGKWQHDPSHRKGAGYRDSGTAGKYGGKSAADAAKSREQFRGRADAGRQDIARGGADQFKGQSPGAGAANRGGDRSGPGDRGGSANRGGGAGDRGGVADRSGAGAGGGMSDRGNANRPGGNDRPATTQNRGGAADKSRPSQSNKGGAFDGVGNGQSARSDSNRGQASRSSPSRPSSSGSASRGSSGASRGGGGGGGGMSRGGGGARGGGGGRGGRR